MSFVRQEEVAGKTVVGSDGNPVGKVKELAFNLTGKPGFVVEGKAGLVTISFDEVQAVGEYVILRGPGPGAAPTSARAAPAATSQPAGASGAGGFKCSSCGADNRTGAKFCRGCGRPLA